MTNDLNSFENALKKNKIIFLFYKSMCPYCIIFEKTWNEFYKHLSKSNKQNVVLFRINVEDIHRDIDTLWEKWKKDKKDKTYILNKEPYNPKVDSPFIGIFNANNNVDEEFKRGTPTILFVNENDYYFYPNNMEKDLIDMVSVFAQAFDEPSFEQEILKEDVDFSTALTLNPEKRFLYLYSPYVISNDSYFTNNRKELNDIDTLMSTANKKFISLPCALKKNFDILNVNKKYNRYDLPFPSIYDKKNDIFYMYKDSIALLDHLIKD